MYEVDQQKGTLTEIQRISAMGEEPWNFGFDPSGKWLLIANTSSDSVDVFSVDSTTGKLTATGESLRVSRPQTIAFFGQ